MNGYDDWKSREPERGEQEEITQSRDCEDGRHAHCGARDCTCACHGEDEEGYEGEDETVIG